MATENTGVIRESELIQLDGTTDKLIQKLETLNSVLIEVAGTMKQHAGSMATSLQKVNVVTENGKKAVDSAEIAASRLEAAYRELEIAMSETGREIVEVKTLTSQANKESKDHYTAIRAMAGSYEALKMALKQAQEDFKKMSAEERENDQIGGVVVERIRQLTIRIKELDAQLKPHVSAIKESAQASQELSVAQSQEARAVEDMSRQTARDTAEKKKNAQATQQAANSTEDLANATRVVSTEYGDVVLSLKDYNRYQKLIDKANASAEGSYVRLQALWKANNILIDNAANEGRELSNVTVKLTEKTRDYYNQMVKMQEATGRYTLNVGNYRSAWDGLGMSVNQLVRELPSAAISLNTFFVAISNNIPILIDEINKLRKTNKLLAEDGKKTIPIGKSIIKALFSWQTAIVLVITALSMFGEEILKAIGSMLGFTRMTLTTKRALKDIAKELETTNDSYGDNVITFKRLKEAYKELNSEAEKTQFLEKYRDTLESLGVVVTNNNELEYIFSHEGTDAVIEAFKKRARAAAAYKLASEKYEESFRLKAKADAKEVASGNKPVQIPFRIGSTVSSQVYSENPFVASAAMQQQSVADVNANREEKKIKGLRRQAVAAEHAADKYFDLAEAENVELQVSTKGSKAARVRVVNLRDLTDQINRMRLSTEEKYQKSMLAIQDDGYAKERAALITATNKKNEELKYNQQKIQEWIQNEGIKYEQFTEEQRQKINDSLKAISDTMINNQTELYENLLKLDAKYAIMRLQVLETMTQDRLSIVQKGSQEEYALQLSLLETQRKMALAEDALLEKDKQRGADAINKVFDQQKEYFKGTWSLEQLEAQQKLEDARFNIIQRSTYATQRFELEQEKQLLEKKLELAKKGQLNLSDVEIKTIEAMIGKIDNEMSLLNQDVTYTGLLSRLGLTDEAIGGLESTVSYVVDQLKRILQVEEELRQQQLDAAKERVSSAQSAYEAELEARNNGYANNVKTARKELILAKEQEKQKEKLLKAAQARTQRLESAMQASSLITASAELWKSFAGIPVVGPALAIAAIGTMWGSFIAAKVKATQLTKQEYGEGGLEMLEGGSHASGNDINLGVKNRRGKRMHAEGGEALAIINKKQTRRYRKILPSIVDSLNKGIFEQKFGSTLPNISPNLIVKSDTDLTNIERNLEAIRNQNDNRMVVMPDGTIIRVNRNVVTKIHK